jgi:hypothetical protein
MVQRSKSPGKQDGLSRVSLQEEAMRWTTAELFLLSDVSTALVFDLYQIVTVDQEAAQLYLHVDVVDHANNASQQ